MAVDRDLVPRDELNRLRIRVRQQGATVTLELAGEWDLSGVPAAGDAIARALTGRPERVVLDLSRLTFVDSTGLHATIDLAERLSSRDIPLVIIPAPGPVQRVFEITGLTGRLPFVDERPIGRRAARPRSARDVAAGSGGSSLPPNGAGRRNTVAGAAIASLSPLHRAEKFASRNLTSG